jgi:hypothetical protein
VIFFSTNCTRRLQSLNLGSIHVTKGKHQDTLAQRAVAAIEGKEELELSVPQAVHMMISSLNSGSHLIVTNCFRKAGFINTFELLFLHQKYPEK